MEESVIHLLAGYGPYAFGVVSLIVIVSVLAFAWTKIVRPEMSERIKLTEAQLKVGTSLEHTSGNVRDTAVALEKTSERLEAIANLCLKNMAEH